MKDIEGALRAGLHDMAEDMGWSAMDAEAVVSRYRRARRARAGVVAVVVAVASVVALPTVVGSLEAAPAGGVAGPGTPTATAAPAEPDAPVEVVGGLTPAEMDQALAEFTAQREQARAANLALGECLTAAGFSVTVHYNGIETSYSEERATVFEAAHAACQAAAGEPAPLSELALRVLYADGLATHACLIAEGFTPGEPVDEAVFLASGGAAWDPLVGVEEPRLRQAGLACPTPRR